MSRILYRAKSARGEKIADFVEASSAAEAMQKLVATGLTEIVLLQSPDIAAMGNNSIAGVSSQQQARLRAELKEKPGLATSLRGMLRLNRWFLLVATALLAFGAWRADKAIVITAVVLLAWPFGLFFWRRRHLDRYQSLMKAYARGQWDEVRRLAPLLRSVAKSRLLPFDLDMRLACIEARQGRLAAALASVEPWELELVEKAPGMYVARVASVHSAAHDYAAYVRLMEQAAEMGKQDPSRLVDVALANAKFGDAARARRILDGLDVKLLPPAAHSFIAFVNGLLCLRDLQPDKAEPHLRTATEGFLERSLKSPASWTALAICSGYYAVALARCGKREAAGQAIAAVMPVLLVHGDTLLLDMLQNEVLQAAA